MGLHDRQAAASISAAGEGDASEPTLDLGFAARKLGQISRSLICLTGHTRADPSTPDRCGDPSRQKLGEAVEPPVPQAPQHPALVGDLLQQLNRSRMSQQTLMHPTERFVPLHFYLPHALDLMYDHLRKARRCRRARSLEQLRRPHVRGDSAAEVGHASSADRRGQPRVGRIVFSEGKFVIPE